MVRPYFFLSPVVFALWIITGCGAEPPAPDSVKCPPAAERETSPESDPAAALRRLSEEAEAESAAAERAAADAEEAEPAPPRIPPPTDTPAETADEAFRKTIEGLHHHHAQAAWYALPPSYRTEINGLVRSFAEEMDPEIWNRAFTVTRRLAAALESKKELAVEEYFTRRFSTSKDDPEAAPFIKEIEKRNEAFLAFLKTIVDSELSELEKLKSFDGERFLAGAGSSVMQHGSNFLDSLPFNPFEFFREVQLMNARITLVTSEGDTATVKFEPAQGEAQEFEMVRVEGYWIPRELKEQWPDLIEQAKMQLQTFSATVAENKEYVLAILDKADEHIAQLETVQTMEELQQVMAAVTETAFVIAMGEQEVLRDKFSHQITVKIRGTIDDETVAHIEELLAAEADYPILAKERLSSLQVDDLLSIEVGPVADIDAFAEKIEFGTVVDVDVEEKIITVDVDDESSTNSDE